MNQQFVRPLSEWDSENLVALLTVHEIQQSQCNGVRVQSLNRLVRKGYAEREKKNGVIRWRLAGAGDSLCPHDFKWFGESTCRLWIRGADNSRPIDISFKQMVAPWKLHSTAQAPTAPPGASTVLI